MLVIRDSVYSWGRVLAFCFLLFSIDHSRGRADDFVAGERIDAEWLPDGQRVVYRVQTTPKMYEFVRVDAEKATIQRAGDIVSLGVLENKPIRSSQLQIRERRSRPGWISVEVTFQNQLDEKVDLYWLDTKGKRSSRGSIEPKGVKRMKTFLGHVWLIIGSDNLPLATWEADFSTQTFVIDGKGIPSRDSQASGSDFSSPDGRWTVETKGRELRMMERKSGEKIPMHAEIREAATWRGRPSWSPDSSAFLLSAAVEVPERTIPIVESSPPDQRQPRWKTIPYAKPGDPLPNPQLVLFHPSTREGIVIDPTLFETPYLRTHEIRLTWAPGGHEAYFDYNQRGHQTYRILAVDAVTGAVRSIVEEHSKTFIDYTRKTWRHWLHNSGEILWMSERSGWCHIYLHDIATGEQKATVTSGKWPVREVLHVDESARQLWFYGSGLREGEDPYHRHLCRVDFDGKNLIRLTEGDGDHQIRFSPDARWFLDTWSRADYPPVHELRQSADGSLVLELERADASSLLASGWTVPERFVAKGRDKKTDIHGVIIKPRAFDPQRHYPVVEEIYAGPHDAFAPKSFGRLSQLHTIADAGFIVVKLDGMGTNHRGKAFHDVAWKNLKDAGFPDRIAWIRAAASTRPWMDLTRVGIYGGSAGGQNAMRAVLDHADFYKVAIADCGCHDNRLDKLWWNEQWMGWPVDESYAASSNVDSASRLGGELLLIVGEMDTNVDPASTLQVVHALQKAGRKFEFMSIIGAGHGAAETAYGSALRLDFLKRHLLRTGSEEK